MKKALTIIGAIVAGLILLAVVGALLPGDDGAPVAEPTERVTVTVTPDPEVITKTKTVTETEVPDACLQAIAAAEKIGGVTSGFAATAAGYPPLVAEAYESGLLGDQQQAQSVLNRMEKLNGRITRHTSRVEPHVERFNSAKAACRAAATEGGS